MSGRSRAGIVRFIRATAGADASTTPDAELLRRFAAGADAEAFRALVDRHGALVWATCRRVLGNHHDAEDAFQATFLVLARGAAGIRSGGAVAGWLCEVAARMSSRLRSAHHTQAARAEPAAGHPDGALGDLTVREAEAILYEELTRLPKKYCTAIVLCCLEGLSVAEAAARLNWTRNQVKYALEGGRERLRSRLARRGVALGVPLLAGLLAPTTASAVPTLIADAAVQYATGTPPPAAVANLANGVTPTMWITTWKWALAATVLSSAGILASNLLQKAEPKIPLAVASSEQKPPAAWTENPKPAWDIATAYLQLIIDNKPEQAMKLARPKKVGERHIEELRVAGLKRVKVAMILLNDSRALVITARDRLKRRPNAEPADDHVVVQLERRDAQSPWLVTGTDIAHVGTIWREADDYLEARFHFAPRPTEPEQSLKPSWDTAEQFLRLVLHQKTADALKLSVPGAITESKVGDVTNAIFASTAPVAILINDTCIEVVFQQQVGDKGKVGHLGLTLTKSKEDTWLVKDIAFHDENQLEERVRIYLAGAHDEKPR